jgi:hypothetical protein
MQTSYHNTNKETGDILAASEEKAKSQEEIIYDYMNDKFLYEFTAEDINEILLPHVPLTSCRRALTNLMNEGKIIKTNNTKLGKYGKQIFTYKYKFTDTLF